MTTDDALETIEIVGFENIHIDNIITIDTVYQEFPSKTSVTRVNFINVKDSSKSSITFISLQKMLEYFKGYHPTEKMKLIYKPTDELPEEINPFQKSIKWVASYVKYIVDETCEYGDNLKPVKYELFRIISSNGELLYENNS